MKKMFGLVGYPIAHSLSPYIQRQLFCMSKNFNCSYNLIEIKKDNIKDFILNQKNLAGFNVTMPYKNYFYENVNDIDVSAKKFKSVNTVIVSKTGKLKGYNTDWFGFFKTLKHFKICLKGNILILGLGGAGKMIATNAFIMGCKIVVAVKKHSFKKAYKTLQNINYNMAKKTKIVDINNIPLRQYDIIINATPVGMHPNIYNIPVNPKIFYYTKTAIDLIYSPKETMFLKKAKSFKIKTINGLYMLLFQAIKSNEIFTGFKFKYENFYYLYKKLKVFEP